MNFQPQGGGIFTLDHSQRAKTVYNEKINRLTTLVDDALVDELVPETVGEFHHYVNGKVSDSKERRESYIKPLEYGNTSDCED